MTSRIVHRAAARGLATGLALLLAACGEPPAPAPEIRPVRTIAAAFAPDEVVLDQVGEIKARQESDLGFRLGGKLVERRAEVGALVRKGDVLARLDEQDQRNALRSAQADLAAARARRVEAEADEARQKNLAGEGFASRARLDTATSAARTAAAAVDAAAAALKLAEDRLSYVVLRADDDGFVTAVGAEPGQVVATGQMVVRLARAGGRDAVFDVGEATMARAPRDPEVAVSLVSDPAVRAVGRVREVSPSADPVTRTFRVKVELRDPPAGMLLGATVRGEVRAVAGRAIALPAGALTETGGKPAVWRFDPKAGAVELVAVTVARHEADRVLIADGIAEGDRVVTAGIHRLYPGQKVRLMEEARP